MTYLEALGRPSALAAVLLLIGCAAGESGVGQGGADASLTDGSGADASGTETSFDLDGSACKPRTCEEAEANCGPVADGCGDLVECGSCTAPEICGGGAKPSTCGTAPCTAMTCQDLGATCGMQGDGCGGLIACGSCTAPETCGGGGVPSECGTPKLPDGGTCVPKKCEDMGFDCGPAADGCGGLVDCGTCTAPDTCGGGGQPSTCGNSLPPCVPRTCASWGANCGPVSDGCGGLTASCGTCSAQETCGGGGLPSVCGGGPACTPRTCSDFAGGTCGPQPDGCGGLTTSCGSCTPPASCGGGGVPSRCGGGPPVCTPKTCSDFPPDTCGRVSDGCGGLTPDCGSCTAPAICGGGGVPSRCGGGGGTSCVNLECKQVTCPGGGTSSVSGIVYDPAGNNPLYNVFVYVPNGPVAPFVAGATCDKCADALSGYPLVVTTTNERGEFTLTNVPVGVNIPLVIQTGKWRRQVQVTTASCVDVPVVKSLTRLPANKSEGDIPKIAISTGGYDPFECLLRKLGIADSEFSNPTGTGRVNLFRGQPTTGPEKAVGQYDPALGGASFPPSTSLWATQASLMAYDMVLLACEGNTYPTTKTTANLAAMYSYVNAGGRVFASHYHHHWVSANTNGTGAGRWSTLASWIYPSPGMYSSTGSLTVPEKVVMTFPKGLAMANWLLAVGGSTSLGNLSVFDTKNSVASFDSSRMLEWIYAENTRSPSLQPIAHAPQYLSFNAPVGASPANQCGRFVFSDIHVSSGDKGASFPSECKSTGMSAQEKALAFMVFDLSSRVCDDTQPQPPPTCTKRTCGDQGIACGPASDGCGGVIASCGTCASPLVCSTGGQCAGSSCTPTTCGALGVTCGLAADGCGGTLTCGSCTPPESCGGGGIPGRCGGSSCVPYTCATLAVECGSWADGCGGTLACGSCAAPQTCGGGGTPGRCGGGSCAPKTCSEMGVACGPSGDGCGGTIDCGPCTTPDGGTGCVPLTCGGRCGPQGDGCGGVLTCPPCTGGCQPTTCSAAGAECGRYPDGCGGLLECGSCVAPETCGGGGTPYQCGIIR